MPTLDELIAQERKIYEFECSFYGKEVVDSEEKLDCVKEHEYHSQIVELLEELKARREAERISDSKPFDVLLVQRYNKALDDFLEKLKENISESLIWGMIADCFKYKNMNDTSDKIVDYVIDTANEISEQLKAGE